MGGSETLSLQIKKMHTKYTELTKTLKNLEELRAGLCLPLSKHTYRRIRQTYHSKGDQCGRRADKHARCL